MFSGSSRLTIDDKGRLAIPARLRTQLADEYGKTLAITLGPEAIELYPQPVFRETAERIKQIADRPKRMLMQRQFVGHATECEPDAQGRVIVPSLLRELKALGNEVVLVGQIDHFELWSEAQWTAATHESQASYADAFAALTP